MNIIKNIDISRKYGVSPTTVANWIEAAINNKNNLQIGIKGVKNYILDTANNHLLMQKMTEDGKKHKNLDARRVIKPLPEFYEIFSESQISEIILGLENYNEILLKYTYLKSGAVDWQNYSKRTIKENIINTISNTQTILNNSIDKILSYVEDKQKINLIDIGPGDIAPIKNMLHRLVLENKINKYIGIDFSPEMLKICETEFKKEFPDNIMLDLFVEDVSNDFFQSNLFKLSRETGLDQNNLNVILFIGSTIENEPNYSKTLLNIVSNISKRDILVIGQTLDSDSGKSYFDLSDISNDTLEAPQQFLWIPRLLNILPEEHTIEKYYSEQENCRKADLILNTDIVIDFSYFGINSSLEFRKGERITLWRHRHHSFDEIITEFNNAGLEIIHTTTSKDMAQVLIMARIKT